MDLGQHAAVLWRFRAVIAGGLALGIVLAVLAAFEVPSFERRGSETWSSESSLLVTQTGFPEGRTTYPTGPRPEPSPGTGQEQSRTDRLEFAAPERFSALANFYAELALSDRVFRRVSGDPERGQIEAVPVEGAAGQPILPVIRLVTYEETAAGARKLNNELVQALRAELTSSQAENDIPAGQRVQLALFKAPAKPVLVSGRSHTASILALLLAVIGSIALAHVLAAFRDRQEAESVDGVVVPWSVGQQDMQQPAQEPGPSGAAAAGSGERDWTERRRFFGSRQPR
jgi:hypothetical protein